MRSYPRLLLPILALALACGDDSSPQPDAGTQNDGGVAMDAGAEMDAATELDAGTEMDAGTEVDGGELDAGTEMDAAIADAGTPDAGSTLYSLVFSANIPATNGEGNDWDSTSAPDPYVRLFTFIPEVSTTDDTTETLDNVMGEVMWEGIVFNREDLENARLSFSLWEDDDIIDDTRMCSGDLTIFMSSWLDGEPHVLNCGPDDNPESRTIVVRVTAIPVG